MCCTIVLSHYHMYFIDNYIFFFFFFFFFFCFLGPYLQPQEVPRQRAELELQLPAYATATQDPSHVCNLHHSSGQCHILNPE